MFYQFHHLGSPDYLKVEHGQDFSFPLHLHQCFEIIVVLEGEMQVTVDGRIFSLHAKDALLIFPNQIHSLRSETSRHILCIFSPRLVQAFTTKLTDRSPVSNQFSPDDYLIAALNRLTPQSSSSEKKGILYLLCHQFDMTAAYQTKLSDSKDLLFRIFSAVEDRFREDCSLSALAGTLGYDYSYLSRYFKKTVGISFNSYVNYYRLSHACYLMENSDRPIIECAFESGYSSLRSFNRNFRDYFHMTPMDYRRTAEHANPATSE